MVSLSGAEDAAPLVATLVALTTAINAASSAVTAGEDTGVSISGFSISTNAGQINLENASIENPAALPLLQMLLTTLNAQYTTTLASLTLIK